MVSAMDIVWITFLPFLELRASIPMGIIAGPHDWLTVMLIAITANIVIGFVVFVLLHTVLDRVLTIPFLHRFYYRCVERTRNKAANTIERYGDWAVAIFIGIPLPGSGVYSGALLAYLMGLSAKKFARANIVGVIIAGILVTLLVLSGTSMSIFLKT